MRTKLRGKFTLLFMMFALMLAMPAVALADLVTVSDADTLQVSGDTSKQAGQTGSARFHLLENAKTDTSDPINNCNANTDNKVKVTVTSSAKDKDGNALATSPVTFASPSYVELEACDNPDTTPVIEGAKPLGYTVGSSAQVGDVITVNAAASGGRTTGGKTPVTGAFSYDTFKITVVAPPEQGTSLSVSPASGTYGGNTSLSATLSSTGTGGVANKSVDFTLNGQSVGSATTNSSGVATLSGVSLSGIDADTYVDAVSASYAGTGSGCTTNCYGPSDGNASLTVNPKPITGSFTADNKTYDGDTSATVLTRSLNGAIANDAVSLSGGTASFDNANAGTGKTVTLSGASLAGTDATNYTLSSVNTTTANINPAALTVTANNAMKTYGDANPAFSVVYDGFVNSEDESVLGGALDFNTVATPASDVGTYPVTPKGLTSGNYSITYDPGTLTVLERPITVTAVSDSKVYNGNTTSDETPRITSGTLVNGDTPNFSQAFDNKNVGTGKILTPSGSVSDGNSGNNYVVTFANNSTGEITKLGITGSFTADNKTYDGTTSATVTGRSPNGAIANDAVSLTGGTATFDNANAGTGKTVTLNGASLAGTDATNYTLSSVNTTTANINPAALTITANNATRLLGDANPTFTVTYSGFVNGQTQSVLGGALQFATNVPNPEQVGTYTITPSGLTSSNYNIEFKTGTLTIIYKWSGFRQPVDNGGIFNAVKAGQSVPMKFSLSGYQGLGIIAAGYPKVTAVACPNATTPVDQIEETTTANSGLTYDSSIDQYNYVWKTQSTYAGKCYRFDMKLTDGTTQSALFKFTK